MPDPIVTGIPEISAWLKGLATVQAKKALARGLAAAAVPIVREVVARTPERSETDRNENDPHVVDSIQTVISISADGQGGTATIGFGKMGYKALWLEYGHRMVGHRPDKKDLGKFIPGRAFMREGLDAAQEESIEKFCSAFSETLDEFKRGAA